MSATKRLKMDYCKESPLYLEQSTKDIWQLPCIIATLHLFLLMNIQSRILSRRILPHHGK